MAAVPHVDVCVDLDAIKANVAALKTLAGDADVLAVVKADAYGHGLVPSARAARAGGATWLGTAVLAEAVALRQAGLSGRVMCWLSAPGEDWVSAIERDVDVSAYAPWAVTEIAQAAQATGRTARLHLKVDTGLGRGGATTRDWPDLIDAALAAQATGAVQVVGLFTHFAMADAPNHPTVRAQAGTFAEAVALAEQRGVRPEVRHLANSAATLTHPDTHWDLVRPGLAVYGLSPVDTPPEHFGLRPAMRVSATVALSKDVPAGQGVSYGHEYLTDQPTRLALVPMGYSDGLPRSSGNRAPVQINGQRHRISGRMCMDQFVVDVGDAPVTAGDQVLLFGDGTRGEPTAQEWAENSDTISYEIVTRMAPHTPRRYLASDDTWLAATNAAATPLVVTP